MIKPELHYYQKKLLELLKQGSFMGLTLRELAQEIGAQNPNTVVHHLVQLEKKGYLRRNPSNPEDYIILKDPIEEIAYVPLYSAAKCGSEGLIAEEHLKDRIPLSTRHFGVTPESFLMETKGDSMEPLIQKDDLVLVEKRDRVEPNRINLVIHMETPKIKKIAIADHKLVLISLNPKYTPLVVDEKDVKPVGLVKNTIRINDLENSSFEEKNV